MNCLECSCFDIASGCAKLGKMPPAGTLQRERKPCEMKGYDGCHWAHMMTYKSNGRGFAIELDEHGIPCRMWI